MISTNNALKQVAGLVGTNDLNDAETDFIEDMWQRSNDGKQVSFMSDNQVKWLGRIYSKHFAQ